MMIYLLNMVISHSWFAQPEGICICISGMFRVKPYLNVRVQSAFVDLFSWCTNCLQVCYNTI